MFETLFSSQFVVARHRSGPLALERERYLHYGATVGVTDSTQRHRAHILLRVARTMSPSDREGVDARRLDGIIGVISPPPTPKCALTIVTTARPWLKYLGWWREPQRPEAFADELQEFVRWMRDERGLSPCTVEQWRDRVATFLLWCGQTGRSLATLEPKDIDAYFVTYGSGRWSSWPTCVAPRLCIQDARRGIDAQGDWRPSGAPQRRIDRDLYQGRPCCATAGRPIRPWRFAMKTSELIAHYLTARRATGTRLKSAERLLYQFARETGDLPLAEVTPAAVSAFLHGHGEISTGWTTRYGRLSGLYRFAIARGHIQVSPLPQQRPKLPPPLTPYVYSREELQRLLDATDSLATSMSELQGTTFRALLLLLYASGLRISEALRLTLADLDRTQRLLIVRETKFYKTRLVPLGEAACHSLSGYVDRRCRELPMPEGLSSALFATRTGQGLCYQRTTDLRGSVGCCGWYERTDGHRVLLPVP